MIKLYDYQEKVVKNVVGHLEENDKAFIDGSVSVGKTVISLGLADRFSEKISPFEHIYIVVSIKKLIPQFRETAKKMGISIRIMAAGEPEGDKDAQIVVAMEQTLSSRLDKVDDLCALYIRDEVHLAYGSSTQKKILKRLKVEKFVGMSGSLFGKDGNHLDEKVKTFEVLSISEMMRIGKAKKIKYIDASDEELTEIFNFSENDSEDKVGKEVIDKASMIVSLYIKKQKKLLNKRTIWFCPNTLSADKIASELRLQGIVAYSYHSNNVGTDKTVQELALKSFMTGELVQVSGGDLFKTDVEYMSCSNIVTVNSLSTGFSVDEIEVGVLTAPIGSKNSYIQRGGRIIRPHETIKTAYLVDMHKNVFKFGKLEKLHNTTDKSVLNELQKRDGVTLKNMDSELEYLLELKKFDDVFSELELKDQLSLFRIKDVDENIESITDYLALTMSLTNVIHGDPYTVETYNGKKKVVKNWYKGSTLSWIAEDFEFLYEIIDDKSVRRSMSAMFRSQCKQIVNQKKNIYGLKFCYSRMEPMLNYFMEMGLYIDKEEDVMEQIKKWNESKKDEFEENSTSYFPEIDIDESDIPF